MSNRIVMAPHSAQIVTMELYGLTARRVNEYVGLTRGLQASTPTYKEFSLPESHVVYTWYVPPGRTALSVVEEISAMLQKEILVKLTVSKVKDSIALTWEQST